jgi:hypothetical protein
VRVDPVRSKLATSNEKEELVRGHGHHCLAGHLPTGVYAGRCYVGCKNVSFKNRS